MEYDKKPKEKKNQCTGEKTASRGDPRCSGGGAGDREERPEIRTAFMERVSKGVHSNDNRDVNMQG